MFKTWCKHGLIVSQNVKELSRIYPDVMQAEIWVMGSSCAMKMGHLPEMANAI